MSGPDVPGELKEEWAPRLEELKTKFSGAQEDGAAVPVPGDDDDEDVAMDVNAMD